MLLLGEEFNPNRKKKRTLFELTVNGQQINNEDDDNAPTDYTAGGDDEGAETTPLPADDTPEDTETPTDYTADTGDDAGGGADTPENAPEDYTVPDEGEGNNPPQGDIANDPAPATTGTDMADAAPAETTGEGEESPADYTTDTGGGDAPAEGDAGGDQGGDAPMEGEGTPEDYTSGEGGGGEEEGAPAEGGEGDPNAGGGEAPADDAGGGDTGGGSEADDEIGELEDDVLGDLSDQQMDIKNKELKTNFANMYDAIIDIEERINDIAKDASMIKPLEFVSNKLSDLSDQVSDYLSYTYPTKSYTENMVMYRMFLNVLSQINDIISTIRPENKPSSQSSKE